MTRRMSSCLIIAACCLAVIVALVSLQATPLPAGRLFIGAPAPAPEQFSGAIFTTTRSGATVNANLFENCCDAESGPFINGGPQNEHSAGLPDGTYYFQVTDPSGQTLLSTDNAVCRQLTVTNGRISGWYQDQAAQCTPHLNGELNTLSGTVPVSLVPFQTTDNPGGEYKVWLIAQTADTSVDQVDPRVLAFKASDAKTDNFKCKAGKSAIRGSKYADLNQNGQRDVDEPGIPEWTIRVEVGSQTLETTTNANGEWALAFDSGTVFRACEAPNTYYRQTGPLAGATASDGVTTAADGCWAGTVGSSDITGLDFGNYWQLLVTKTAQASFKRTYAWTIEKDVDKTAINIAAGGSATFEYTVTVTPDAGTDSEWEVSGSITITNPHDIAISNVTVADVIPGESNATCALTDTFDGTVPAKASVELPYKCSYSARPGLEEGSNQVTVSWADGDAGKATATAAFSFTNAPVVVPVDRCVAVEDTLGGTLGQYCAPTATAPSDPDVPVHQGSFNYSKTFAGTVGTCTSYDNTATFTADNSKTTGSSSETVKVCVGADLTVTKTAVPSFTRTYGWTVDKLVNQNLVERIGGGTTTLAYTVNAAQTGVVDSNWLVTGTITVTNPNDWEDVVFTPADVAPGATCAFPSLSGTTATVPKSGSIGVAYSCTFGTQPAYNSALTNRATATWDSGAYFTPAGSAEGDAGFQFSAPTSKVNPTLTVTDTLIVTPVGSGLPTKTETTLGTLTATDGPPYASATYSYTNTVNIPIWDCSSYGNRATTGPNGPSDGQDVKVCGPARTGALTMGFWHNKNGQGIIKADGSSGDGCNVGTWLRGFAPFQDLPGGANCNDAADYVLDVIKAASAGGTAMNAMLKAQMLATALDVYFGGGPGGNKIGSPLQSSLGVLGIDLTSIAGSENCSAAFGGATHLTVLQMLEYASSQSNAGGGIWYGNVKAVQGLAKDAFDAINNQKVFAPF